MDSLAEVALNLFIVVVIAVIGILYFRNYAAEWERRAASSGGKPGSQVSRDSRGGKRPRQSASPAASAAASAAVAATTAAVKAQTTSSQRYEGVVKRFSDRNGMGFIVCDETRALYNVDVRIFRDEFESSGLKVGEGVAFNTVLGGRANCPRNHPWATNVERTKAAEEVASAAAGEVAASTGTPPAAATEPGDDVETVEDDEPARPASPRRPAGSPGPAQAPAASPFSRQAPPEALELSAGASRSGAAVAASRPGGLRADAKEFVPPAELLAATDGGQALHARRGHEVGLD